MTDHIMNIPLPLTFEPIVIGPREYTFIQTVLGAPPQTNVEYTFLDTVTTDIPGYSIINLQDLYLTPTPQFIIPLFLNSPSTFFSEFDRYHEVTAYDQYRIDLISYRYYLTTDYWWIIALSNNILDPFNIVIGTILRIPSDGMVTNEWLHKPVKKLRATDTFVLGSA